MPLLGSKWAKLLLVYQQLLFTVPINPFKHHDPFFTITKVAYRQRPFFFLNRCYKSRVRGPFEHKYLIDFAIWVTVLHF